MTRHAERRGFTIVETGVALVTLAIAGVIIAQLLTWLLNERIRADQRQAALEWAVNVLEAARAQPWADVNAEWAANQRLPSAQANRLNHPTATVRVESVPGQTGVKQITAEVRWLNNDGTPTRPIVMTTRLANRSPGGRP